MRTLKYTSMPLHLLIGNYKPMRFTCGKYTYSDEYTLSKDSAEYGDYILHIESGDIQDHGELNRTSIDMQEHVKDIEMFLKYITGTCLFMSSDSFDYRRKRFIVAGVCPDGWSTNYPELDELLDTNKIRIEISHHPSRPYAQIPESPLAELKIILEKYKKADKNIRYLMRLNYEADMASDAVRCLVYGKVLEIIDALHPLKGNLDKRIDECFDGMQELFKGKTIKDLMGLANTRADSRHYAAQKGTVIPHPFLTYEELGIYCPLIDNLAVNEVRGHFDLPMVLLVGA